MEPIILLTTLNQNYLPQLRVLLTSIFTNNPGETISLYLLHQNIPSGELRKIELLCKIYGYEFHPIIVQDSLFLKAPASRQYPREMYYRLLAPHLLPKCLKKALYLDPDILVINSLRPLWELKLNENLFAAASHTGRTQLANGVNQLRLGTQTRYYNSGVLLINLKEGRKRIVPEELFRFVEEHGKELLLPDQDILNALYGNKILPLEDVRWNYDARFFRSYLVLSGGEYDLNWVMSHTAILHFCGKEKPWKKGYSRRFGILYQHYNCLAERTMIQIPEKQ